MARGAKGEAVPMEQMEPMGPRTDLRCLELCILLFLFRGFVSDAGGELSVVSCIGAGQ